MSWLHTPRALLASAAAAALATTTLTAPAEAAPSRAGTPTIAIGDATVVEGTSGNRVARFTVMLSATSATEVRASWTTVAATAAAGSDFVAATGTVRVPAGALTATLNVSVRGDAVVEPTETFNVRLSAPVGGTFKRATGIGRITNDDPPKTGLRIAAGDASLTEGNAGSRNLTLPVTLSGPAPATVTVDWATVAGTATVGTDYTARSGRLTFATGATTAYLTVPIVGDTQHEPTEKLTVRLTTPTGGALIGRPNGALSITNDDAAPPPSPVGKLAAGNLHTCAVVAGGGVRCWGFNDDGQLGNGTRAVGYTPVSVTGLSGVVAITAGQAHTCAVLADTTVRCWGLNTDLELGLGVDTQVDRNTDRLTPVVVPGLTGVVAIDAGGHHTCAILTGGTVKCWGEGYGGRMGNGGDTDVASPTTVPGWAGAVQISAGREHTCARWADGSVKCAGYNFNGELGDGSRTNRPTPVPVSGISGASSVVTGQFHTCVIVAAVPRCFGYNFEGALGDGTQEMRLTPVAMLQVTGAANVSLGQDHTCVTLTSGAARCVGFNGSDGRLGNNSTDDSFTSVPVTELSGGTVIESGVFHTCAVVTGNAVRCWGANAAGQLGNGGVGTLKPVTVTGLTVG